MHPDPSIDIPLFIPDDWQDLYRQDAATQVLATRPAGPAPVARPRPRTAAAAPKSARHGLYVVVAVVMALIGGIACTAWWAWLAHETGSTMWNNFAVGGGVAVVLGVIAAVGAWLSNH